MLQRTEPERSATSFMGRHFVALSCNYESLKPDGTVFHRGTQVFSGFIIELRDRWYWVTAGHCLQDELDDLIRRNVIRVVGGGFVDYLGFEAKHFSPYPYVYVPGDGFYIFERDAGLDFAFVPLDELMRAAFASNGVVPINRENWIHQCGLSFAFYRMLGIPRGRVIVSEAPDGNEEVSVGLALLAIDALTPNEIAGVDDLPPNMFVGRIAPEAKIDTIKGMSGGPIYGFRYDAAGRLLYHVVALQSLWRERSRIVFGCPVPFVAERMFEFLSMLDARQ